MFETAEVGNKVDKETYNREAPKVREALLAAQRELAAANFAVVVVIGGVEGAGKGETVNLLLEWLDARSTGRPGMTNRRFGRSSMRRTSRLEVGCGNGVGAGAPRLARTGSGRRRSVA